jgi:hypothetical protein
MTYETGAKMGQWTGAERDEISRMQLQLSLPYPRQLFHALLTQGNYWRNTNKNANPKVGVIAAMND